MARRQQRPPVSPRPRRGWSRLIALAVIVLAVGAAALIAMDRRSRATAAARLPALPALAGEPAAIVRHLADADAAARRAPTDADLVGALGMSYHADLFYEQAVAAYRVAAALDAQNWRWTYHRALVHLERGQAEDARAALHAVVGAAPHLAIAWWRLGESAFKQARYDEAEAAYVRAEEASRSGDAARAINAYARLGRARVALQRGDARSAETLLAALLGDEPRFGPAHHVRAEALRQMGRADEADLAALRGAALRAYVAPPDPLLDALADRSRSSVFLLRAAATHDSSRDPARREQLTRSALAADPDNPDVVYEMGSVLQQLGRPSEALALFTRHLDLVDDDLQTLVQMGKCYSDMGRLPDAEAMLRRAVALGDDAVGIYNLGVVVERAGRVDEAEASYRRAIALSPAMAGAHNNLGALLARKGQTAEAMQQLSEAIRLDPSAPDGYTNLSAMLLQHGRTAEAERYARQALDVAPQHADAHVNLAVALAQSGDIDGARRHLDQALQIDPRHRDALANRAALTR